MAGGAGNVVLRVLRPAYLSASQVFRVAAEARVEDSLWRELAERDDRCLAALRLHVRLAGPMAGLAAGVLGRRRSRCQRLVMRILVEIAPNVRMAGSAHCATDILRCLRVGGRGKRPGL